MNLEEKLNGREVREIYRVGFGGLGFDGWGSMVRARWSGLDAGISLLTQRIDSSCNSIQI